MSLAFNVNSPLYVPGELDFFNAEVQMGPGADLLFPILKERLLFFGSILLPMEFLLFNRQLHAFWRGDGARRSTLEAFLDDAGLIITRPDKPTLREFAPRLEEAVKAGNPAVTPDISMDYATFLEERTAGQTTNVYFDSLTRLHKYASLFVGELDHLRAPHRLPEELTEKLISEVGLLTQKYAPNKPVIDGTDALSRGGITRVLRYSSEPLLLPYRDLIANCAHHAYLRNVASTFANPTQEAQPLLHSDAQLTRSTVMDLTEPDFVEELKRVVGRGGFGIDWLAVRNAPWSAIRAASASEAARTYFAARATVIRDRRPEDLRPFALSLCTYMEELERRFPVRGLIPKSVLQVFEVGSCVTIAVVGFITKTESPIVQIPIVWALGRWLSSTWISRRRQLDTDLEQEARLDRMRGIASRQYYLEDHQDDNVSR